MEYGKSYVDAESTFENFSRPRFLVLDLCEIFWGEISVCLELEIQILDPIEELMVSFLLRIRFFREIFLEVSLVVLVQNGQNIEFAPPFVIYFSV